jgi:hypothetical protein
MATETIKYRGYELHIEPAGTGLKVKIRATGVTFSRPEIPHSRDKDHREELFREAKAIVDALLDAPHEKKKID